MSDQQKLADDAVLELLETVDSDVLIRTFASLTHRIDAGEKWVTGKGMVPPDMRGIRAQRDKVQAEMNRRMNVGPQVVGLWNRLNGWIPGGSYQQLAEVLHVHTDLLVHWDQEQNRRHCP